MKNIDLVKKNNQNSTTEHAIIINKNNNLKNHKEQKSSARLKQSKKAWFFSFLAILLVIMLWFFSLKENWQRINQKQQANNENEINNLKIKFNKLFGETSEFLDNLDTFGAIDNELPNTTSTDADIIENQTINKTPTLTDEQINNLTNKLKEIKKNQEAGIKYQE